ncbi:SDH family Clp fold serine proteinase [Nocardia nova]
MPSWDQILTEFGNVPTDEKAGWLQSKAENSLAEVGKIRGGRNVILYGAAFLQKPDVPGASIMITYEDLNGLMSVIYGMDCSKGLTLILHTPGGVTNAAETLVSYLRSKFSDIEVIVPAFAMSAGTMISLAADRIIMGRQSQLGPIDPQMSLGPGGTASARSITEQFDRAKTEVLNDTRLAHLWAPIVQTLGPGLLQEAQNALDYSERMVASWLTKWMFHDRTTAAVDGETVAKFFNDASSHKSHGRRIDREEARSHGVTIEDLEDNQDLQERVLTAYHMLTIVFQQSPAVKVIASSHGRFWMKNWTGQVS